jgi:spore maturation protein CgeB
MSEYNELIVDMAEQFRPDFLCAFKGSFVQAKTLALLRTKGIKLYNYYPDRVIFESRTYLGQSLSEYDCVFDTKSSWDGDAATRVKLRSCVFLPHGYDPDFHKPVDLTERDRLHYGCDVSLIAY